MNVEVKQKVESLEPSEAELRRPPRPQDPTLKPERVQEWLQAFPVWRLLPSGDALVRERDFPSGVVAASYAAFVAAFAHREGLMVFLECTAGKLSITLRSHDRQGVPGGVTEKVLEFAQALG
jgi:pterin-4a-carbinolamine dehydratase